MGRGWAQNELGAVRVCLGDLLPSPRRGGGGGLIKRQVRCGTSVSIYSSPAAVEGCGLRLHARLVPALALPFFSSPACWGGCWPHRYQPVIPPRFSFFLPPALWGGFGPEVDRSPFASGCSVSIPTAMGRGWALI